MKNIVKVVKENRILALIILLGAILRYYKIDHGYPFIINIDEPALVRSTLGLFHSPNIEHFDWPHVNYYVHFVFYFLFVKFRGLLNFLGLNKFFEPMVPALWNDPFAFYYLSRFINATFGVLTVIPVYLLGKIMFNKRVGLTAAFLLSLLPAHIFFSHFAIQEPSLLFWVSWAIYFAYVAVKGNKTKDFIISGFLFAIAAGSKYHASILTITMPFFALVQIGSLQEAHIKKYIKKNYKKFVYAALTSMVTFVITNYRIIMDWEIFWSYDYGRGFLWQVKINSVPVHLSEYPYALLKNFWGIALGFGIIPIAIYFVSAKKFLFKKLDQKALKYMALFVGSLVFIFFTARISRANPHYFVPTYGLILVLVAAYLDGLDEKIMKKIILVIIALLILFNFGNIYKFKTSYTQREALNFYVSAKENGKKTYMVEGALSTVNMINNLGIAKLKDDSELTTGDIIISRVEVYDDRMSLVSITDNRLRDGPVFYVYSAN